MKMADRFSRGPMSRHEFVCQKFATTWNYSLIYHHFIIVIFQYITQGQCDQMVRLFVQCLAYTKIKICPITKIFGKVGWKLCRINPQQISISVHLKKIQNLVTRENSLYYLNSWTNPIQKFICKVTLRSFKALWLAVQMIQKQSEFSKPA